MKLDPYLTPHKKLTQNGSRPKTIKLLLKNGAQFTIAKSWKQRKCPSANEWIKKLWYIYTMEFYTAEKMKEIIPFATAWMELESIMLSEIKSFLKKYGTNASKMVENLLKVIHILEGLATSRTPENN